MSLENKNPTLKNFVKIYFLLMQISEKVTCNDKKVYFNYYRKSFIL